MFSVYVLYSAGSGKTYTGYTSDLNRRLLEHNVTGTKGFSRRYRPWVLIHEEQYASKAEAMLRERFYKSGQGREEVRRFVDSFLSDRVRYPPEAEKD